MTATNATDASNPTAALGTTNAAGATVANARTVTPALRDAPTEDSALPIEQLEDDNAPVTTVEALKLNVEASIYKSTVKNVVNVLADFESPDNVDVKLFSGLQGPCG